MNDDNSSGINRRTVLKASLTLVTAGCGGGGSAPNTSTESDPTKALPIPEAQPAPVTPFVPGKHRFQQARLFQRAHAKVDKFIYTNSLGVQIHSAYHDIHYDMVAGAENCHRMVGATGEYLCWASRWPWKNRGGDFVDANGQRQGTTPFAKVSVAKNAIPALLEIDVLTAFRYIIANRTWSALLLKVGESGTLKLNGVLHPSAAKSQVELKFSDGSIEMLSLWYTSSALTSTVFVNAHEEVVPVSGMSNGFIEFDRPAQTNKTLSSAKLRLSHAGTDALTLSIYVIAPLLPDTTPIKGIAATQSFDAGVKSHPNVLLTQLVTDSMSIEDVLDTAYSGTYAAPYRAAAAEKPLTQRQEAYFDPTLWGQPALTEAETARLLPRRGFGKWIGQTAPDNTDGRASFSLVHSDYKQFGFVPLAPGLGALHLTMPKRAPPNGTTWRVDGESGTDVDMWLPRSHIGRVRRIRFRYYVLLGDGWEARDDQLMLHFLSNEIGKYPEQIGYQTLDSLRSLKARPSDNSGKMFGGAQHLTSGVVVKEYVYPTRLNPQGQPDDTMINKTYGGGYGASSGGDVGYQGRMMWTGGFHKKLGGPAEGGLVMGMELYDMQNGRMAPSQVGIKNWDSSWHSSFAHNGGLGHIFKDGKWRCIEFEWQLNPNQPYELPPRGTHFAESGSAKPPTGYLRAWVDGILASETPNFGFTRLPKVDWSLQLQANAPFDKDPGSPARFRPITNVSDAEYLGFASLAGNLYYGGRSPCPVERHLFINGLVVAVDDAYIGPMAGVAREHGGLGAAGPASAAI